MSVLCKLICLSQFRKRARRYTLKKSMIFKCVKYISLLGEKPFRCLFKTCLKRFRYKGDLSKHIKRYHPGHSQVRS